MFFSFGEDINKGMERFKNTKDALLVDVREEDEFKEGHIPGAYNLPLSILEEAPKLLDDKAKPLFVYCHSGARSANASRGLKSMGFTDVNDIGGIMYYKGAIE